MNAVVHSEISSKRWKAPAEDFLAIHDFVDCSKELIPNNLHRCATHHHAFIKQVVIPIFGHTLHCSNGVNVNVKDLLEFDHLIVDFGGRYIASLSDYIDLCEDSPGDKDLIETFYSENKQFLDTYPEIRVKLLDPLANTGKLKSLLITHNSWFIGKILPLIFPNIKIELKDYNINPAMFFNRCRYADWLDNGRSGHPPSFEKILEKRRNKINPKKDIFNTPIAPYPMAPAYPSDIPPISPPLDFKD